MNSPQLESNMNQTGRLSDTGTGHENAQISAAEGPISGLLQNSQGTDFLELFHFPFPPLFFSAAFFFSSSTMDSGTLAYLENSMVNSALPCVRDLRVVA